MHAPERSEVAAVLRRLIEGEQTRQSASAWALTWMLGDESEISDPEQWAALELLGAADLVGFDRPYLYVAEDFRVCLEGFSMAV